MLKLVLKTIGLITLLSVLGVALANSGFGQATGQASFNEVWKVVTTPPIVATDLWSQWENSNVVADINLYGTQDHPTLPQYSGTIDVLASMLTGALKTAATRTIANREDYHNYFKKLVHANGICFAGMWEITEDSVTPVTFKRENQHF